MHDSELAPFLKEGLFKAVDGVMVVNSIALADRLGQAHGTLLNNLREVRNTSKATKHVDLLGRSILCYLLPADAVLVHVEQHYKHRYTAVLAEYQKANPNESSQGREPNESSQGREPNESSQGREPNESSQGREPNESSQGREPNDNTQTTS